MKSFNVLDRKQNIHCNFLLEASAGTGKTYSIENLAARILIDELFPCDLEQILIVTYTKAACHDLKLRIRENFSALLKCIKQQNDGPDFLQAIRDTGPQSLQYAQKKLENALTLFDQAHIYTIHGFCNRMLKENIFEGNVTVNRSSLEEGIPTSKLCNLVRDFFRTEVSGNLISTSQLKLLLKDYNLENELCKHIKSHIEIEPGLTFAEILKKFNQQLKLIKTQLNLKPDLIVEDFLIQAPFYNKICKGDTPKSENVDKVKKFANLFDKEQASAQDLDAILNDGLYLTEVIHSDNQNKKKKLPVSFPLHYPQLIPLLNEMMAPLIKEATHSGKIYTTVAQSCKKMIEAYMKREDLMGPDELLLAMHEAIVNTAFAEKIRQRFHAVIIDEFQDTDPIQWEIFRNLFLTGSGNRSRVYLVGDPKQAIYGFRQGDIYTYLKAGNSFPRENLATLDTNYRSTQSLIAALNGLFDSSLVPGWISLPRLQQSLVYHPVKCGEKTIPLHWNDTRGSVHFFSAELQDSAPNLELAEEEYFFPFIAQEISRLHKELGCNFNQFAVLAGDRRQISRITQYFRKLNIPFVSQKSTNITNTSAFASFKEILKGIAFYRNESSLKTALGTTLLGWTDLDILQLENQDIHEVVLSKSAKLRKIWTEQGFAQFFQELLKTDWLKDETLAEHMISLPDGLELYQDVQQIAEILIDHESEFRSHPQQLIDYLDELENSDFEEDKTLNRRNDPGKEGVRILTIHSSKGLEFDIVFAMGVVKRSPLQDEIIPYADESDVQRLTAVVEKSDPRYLQYCQELDAEKARLLYVALTRAKQRVYIPLLFAEKLKKCAFGTASPIELFVARMGQPETTFEQLYARINSPNRSFLYERIKDFGKSLSIGLSVLNAFPLKVEAIQEKVIVELKEPPVPIIPGSKQYLHSFSSLSNHAPVEKMDLENETPHNFLNPIKNSHTLPAGSEAGNALHLILETIPLTMVRECKKSQDLLPFVNKFIQGTSFEEWTAVFCEMVFNAFHAKIPFNNEHLFLKDIGDNNHFREHEFLYPAQNNLHPELHYKPGFLKGVIDFIFQHEGRFYIVDWKSNWLGTTSDSYQNPSLHKAMQENDYFLQAKLYKEALQRYLKLFDPRPFPEIFGGIYYIFLRGLEAESTNGVYKVEKTSCITSNSLDSSSFFSG